MLHLTRADAAGNQGQSSIDVSILAGDVKVRHDKMVEPRRLTAHGRRLAAGGNLKGRRFRTSEVRVANEW
jgi:hypothetical protein